jgi:hypothetical protein
VCPEKERRHDAEVASTPADRPVEILVLFGAGGDRAPVGQHNVGGQQVVDGEAVLPGQVTDAATQSQPRDSGGGDGAGWDCQTVLVAAAAHPNRSGVWVDLDVLHSGEIDDKAVVAQTQAAAVVTAAPDRREHLVLPAESHRRLDVINPCAVGDHAGPLVYHSVVDLAGLVVAGVAGLYELAAQVRLELRHAAVAGHSVPPLVGA